jgi:uncharacterized damage-inducible protein DinB
MRDIRRLVPAHFPCREPIIAEFLAILDDARERTRVVLRDLPPAALHWQLRPELSSIGDLLYHIGLIEADWLYAEVLETEYPAPIRELLPEEVSDAQGRLTHVKEEPIDVHLRRLATIRTALIEVFLEMDLAEFRRLRSLPGYDVSPEWVLHHLAQHEAEHRYQMKMIRKQAEQRSQDPASTG